jgi:ABC-type sugar transport system permease subunit
MNEIMSRVRQVPRIRASDISSRKVKGAIEGYLYLAPALIILTIFVFVPIVSSFQMSLTRVAPFGNRTIDVGLGNYERLWNSPEYRNAVKDTLIFALGVVPTSIILSVMLGIALSYPLKHLSWFHRLLIFLPIVLSAAVTGVLFRWVFHPVVGYINYMLDLIGIDGPSWLSTWAVLRRNQSA